MFMSIVDGDVLLVSSHV